MEEKIKEISFKQYEEYAKEVMLNIFAMMKLGYNGSQIADELVMKYNMERKNALGLIIGTMIIVESYKGVR